MAPKRYSRFNSLMQKIASTRPGALLFSRALHPFDRLFLRITRGRTTMTSLLSGLPVVILNTKGAKSGLPRIVPVLCIRDECTPNALIVIASNRGQRRHPAWYFNLKANPLITCSIGGQVGTFLAHEACDEEYDRLWRCAVETYIGFPLYRQRAGQRHIPIMVLEPVKSSIVPMRENINGEAAEQPHPAGRAQREYG